MRDACAGALVRNLEKAVALGFDTLPRSRRRSDGKLFLSVNGSLR
jgi:hypothetical protein